MNHHQIGTEVARSAQTVVQQKIGPRSDLDQLSGELDAVHQSSVRSGNWARRMREFWNGLDFTRKLAVAAIVGQSLIAAASGHWISERIQSGVLQNSARTNSVLLESLIGPLVQDLVNADTLSPGTQATLRELLERSPLKGNIAELRIWRRDGVVVFDSEGSANGQLPPVMEEIEAAFGGEIRVELNDAHHDHADIERKHAMTLFEINSPIHASASSQVIAVAEFYQGADKLHADLAVARRQSWLLSGLLGLALLLPLVPIIRNANRTLEEQRKELRERKEHGQRLQEQNVALQVGIEQAHRRGADINERSMRRIGADLHDGPAQLVGLALLKLDELIPPLKASPAGAERHLETLQLVRQALTDSLKEIRSIAAGLALPELERITLAAALELAARSHEQRTRSTVSVAIGPLPTHLPLPITICLFRFAQEALNNAYRHAGGKGQSLIAGVEDGEMRVIVGDAGSGFDVTTIGDRKDKLGLAGLKNRVESLGGRLQVSSMIGRGTELTASFKQSGTLKLD